MKLDTVIKHEISSLKSDLRAELVKREPDVFILDHIYETFKRIGIQVEYRKKDKILFFHSGILVDKMNLSGEGL